MRDKFDPNSTNAMLFATCKSTAEELENVGKRYCRTCGECTNCQKHELDETLSKEYGVEFGGYYCAAKSELDDETAEYYECSPYDDWDGETHGDYNSRTGDTEPCADFDLKPDIPEETFYESMYDWLNDQLDIEFTITSRGEYKNGVVVIGTGGPHIEVDTRKKCVLGYWGSDTASEYVSSDAIDSLDEVLEEMYESSK